MNLKHKPYQENILDSISTGISLHSVIMKKIGNTGPFESPMERDLLFLIEHRTNTHDYQNQKHTFKSPDSDLEELI